MIPRRVSSSGTDQLATYFSTIASMSLIRVLLLPDYLDFRCGADVWHRSWFKPVIEPRSLSITRRVIKSPCRAGSGVAGHARYGRPGRPSLSSGLACRGQLGARGAATVRRKLTNSALNQNTDQAASAPEHAVFA